MNQPAADTRFNATEINAVTDWFYHERWHQDLADLAELEWLLHWLLPDQIDRRIEIADAVSIMNLEAGNIDAAIALTQATLSQCDDFGLQHTLALAQAAHGDLDAATRTLTHALQQANTETSPPDQIIQAWLDLARIHQNNRALFKAIAPIKQAIALAKAQQKDELLQEGVQLLVEQLIDQGGMDEAWDTLKPLLSQEPSPLQQALWALAFTQLAQALSPADIDQGAAFFLAAKNPEPLVRLMIGRAQSAQDHQTLLLAFILGLMFLAPIDVTAPLAAKLLRRDEDRQKPTAPLIAAATMALAEIPDERSIKRAHWYRDAMMQLISVAQHQGVPEAAVKQWAIDAELLLEHHIIERTCQVLMKELTHTPPWLSQAMTLSAAIKAQNTDRSSA
jgi:tetratricopeptide (TPR) repeat protein